MKYAAVLLSGLFYFLAPVSASAQETVECISHNYQYAECRAPLDRPQLVYQSSGSPCIVNRTWGFNRRTGYIWVSEGCSGVFADVGGYHHGRVNSYDNGARHYDHHGNDGGAVAGTLFGALLVGAVEGANHTTSNRHPKPYDGCHGSGCLVDNPDRPAPRANLYQDGIERCTNAAVARARAMGQNPRIGRIIDKYPDSDGYHVEGEVNLTRSDGDFSMHFLCVWDGNRATALLGSGP